MPKEPRSRAVSSLAKRSGCFKMILYSSGKGDWEIVQCQSTQVKITLSFAVLPGAIKGLNKHSVAKNQMIIC